MEIDNALGSYMDGNKIRVGWDSYRSLRIFSTDGAVAIKRSFDSPDDAHDDDDCELGGAVYSGQVFSTPTNQLHHVPYAVINELTSLYNVHSFIHGTQRYATPHHTAIG